MVPGKGWGPCGAPALGQPGVLVRRDVARVAIPNGAGIAWRAGALAAWHLNAGWAPDGVGGP